jgi:hypothetical protein
VSQAPTGYRRRARPRRRSGRAIRVVALLVLLAAVFALGVALGQALENNPKPGSQQTGVRQLRPLPLAPARETVTVTVGQR